MNAPIYTYVLVKHFITRTIHRFNVTNTLAAELEGSNKNELLSMSLQLLSAFQDIHLTSILILPSSLPR